MIENFERGKDLGRYLVTSDNWFETPGGQFKSVVGPMRIVKADDVMGFVPKGSANWFVIVGDLEGEHVVIAGCQVHHLHRTDAEVTNGNVLRLEGER